MDPLDELMLELAVQVLGPEAVLEALAEALFGDDYDLRRNDEPAHPFAARPR